MSHSIEFNLISLRWDLLLSWKLAVWAKLTSKEIMKSSGLCLPTLWLPACEPHLAVDFKNQVEALLNNHCCGLKERYVFFLNFFFFIVPLTSLACPSHSTFVPAGLVLSVSIDGSIWRFLGVREAQILVAPGTQILATYSVVLSTKKDASLT